MASSPRAARIIGGLRGKKKRGGHSERGRLDAHGNVWPGAAHGFVTYHERTCEFRISQAGFVSSRFLAGRPEPILRWPARRLRPEGCPHVRPLVWPFAFDQPL